MHTVLVLNPGHFHAALVFRESHPRLSGDIHVYSEPGPDLDRFLEIVRSFNERKTNPTRWELHVYTGEDGLERLISEKKGDLVVLAGKNNARMELIDTLTRAGFSILGDKPWLTTGKALPFLRSTLASDRPLAVDIMTERYEITTTLQKEFIAEKEVLGEVRIDPDGSPSVYKESVHHLYKIVNERPLVRPPWFFDIRIQGEGLVDVSTHLVDMTHWMLFPGEPIQFEEDIELLDARRWPTPVPLHTFRKITQMDHYPDSLRQDVKDDVLHYYCNGDLFYRVRNIPVHIRILWNLEIPEGGGDTHRAQVKGTRSDLMIRQLPERGFVPELLIAPHEDLPEVEESVKACLDRWSDRFPGLSVMREDENLLIHIPDALRTTHEEHFCQVRDAFLDHLETGALPVGTRACLLSKYTLLAEARKRALGSPFEPLKV